MSRSGNLDDLVVKYADHARHLASAFQHISRLMAGKKVTRERILKTMDGYSFGICDQVLADLEKDFPT